MKPSCEANERGPCGRTEPKSIARCLESVQIQEVLSPILLLAGLALLPAAMARADEPEPEAEPADQDLPQADRESPSEQELAAAPPPDQASGLLREHAREGGLLRGTANALLWVPRSALELSLLLPDLLIGEVDDYLEQRGPNIYDRGKAASRWSFGGMLRWEAPFGPSIGAQVGRRLGDRWQAEVTAVAFGRHGYTGRAAGSFEPRPDGALRIELDTEYAHGRETALAGIGDHPLGDSGTGVDPLAPGPVPLAIVDDRALAVMVGVPIRPAGRFRLRPAARFERHQLRPDDEAGFPYDRALLVGLDQPFALATARLDAVYDDREARFPWIPRTAPSTGWRLRGSLGYTRGEVNRPGDGGFQLVGYGASAERLFDLFHGTRVLAVRARFEAVTADRSEVPFLLLPSLGGPAELRAFPRGRFRDRVATSGEVAYEWAIGLHARASLFCELGGVHPGLDALEAGRLHLSPGGALRFALDRGTAARAVIARSSTGEMSFLLLFGGV
jgi:hypothetical protein